MILRIVATEQLSHFHTDAVDIAIRHGRPPFGGGLVWEWLFDNAVVAVGSPSTLDRKVADPATLVASHTLLHDSHNLWPQFVQEALELPVSTAAGKSLHFNQTSLAIDAAMAGQGIALAPYAFVEHDILAGRLARVFDAELGARSGFYAVTPRRAAHPGPVAVVRAWLLQETHQLRRLQKKPTSSE